MQRLIVILTTIVLLSSCNYIENYNTKNRLQGTWIPITESNLVSAITFNNDNCTFEYLGFKMGASYTRDENVIYIKTGTELGTMTFQIKDETTLIGGFMTESTYKQIDAFRAKGKPSVGNFSTVSALNLRTGKSTKHQVITKIPANSKVKAIKKESEGWVKIEYDGFEGYVSSKYLK